MAPSPAAGKQTGGVPKTPTKLGRKPGATPQKLSSSSAKAPSTPKAAGAKKPDTTSPSLPSRPKGIDSGKPQDKVESTKDEAEDSTKDAEDSAKTAGEEAQSNVEMKDDDEEEGPLDKVTEAGDQAQEGLQDAAPEPIEDDEDDAVGGATEKAEATAEDAEEQADNVPDVPDDTTEKAGDVEEDEATDDQDGLAGKAAQDPAGAAKEAVDDTKEAVEDTAEDAEETTEDGTDEAQKVAGETTDEAGDAADGAQDEADEATEGVTEEAEETAEGAEETAEEGAEPATEVAEGAEDDATETAEGAEDKVGETTEDAEDEAAETAEGAEEETPDIAEGAEEESPEVAEGAEDEAVKAAEGAEDAEDKVDETAEGAEGETGEVAEGAEDETKATAEDAQEEGAETAEAAKDEAGEDVEVPEGETPEVAEGAEDQVNGVEDEAEGAEDGEAKSSLQPEDLPLDLSVLKGLEVSEDGTVYDKEGNAIGTLAEGDAEDLAGYEIGDEGEILDDDGDLVGRCELLPEEIKKQLAAAKERGDELPEGADEYLEELDGEKEGEDGEEEEGEDAEEEEQGPALPGLSILDGLTCQIDGLIYDADGNTVGKVVEGDPEELQNATLNDQGEFIDEEGNVVGRAAIHQDAADLVEQGIYEPEEGVVAVNDAGEEVNGVEDAADDEEGVDGEDGEAMDVDGAEELAEGEEGADGIEEELPGIEDQLPGIEALQGLELNEAGDVVNEQGDVLAQIVDEDLKQKIADGEIDPATLHIDEEGQIVDEEGNVLGGDLELAEGAAEKLRGGPILDQRILDGKKVNKKGEILNEDGELIGELRDGEIKDCAGKKANDKGEVLDKNGEVVGHVSVVPGEAAETATQELLEELGEAPQSVPAPDLPGLDILDGLKVNKKGQILDEDGEVIGELVDGELSECAGKKANEKGEVLDKEGNVIGRVRTLPPPGQEEEPEVVEVEEQGPEDKTPGLEVLEGRKVSKSGKVFDDDAEAIGELSDGELSDCAGKKVNEKGEVIDNDGNIIGHVTLIGQEEEEEAAEAVPEDKTPGLEILEGRKVAKSGKVFDDDGEPIGELADGELAVCAGKKLNENGEVLDDEGNIIGHVTLIGQEEPEEEQGPQLPPLSVLEGLTCNKAGKVVDDNGTIVGELVEGDAKKISKLGITADAEGQFWDNKGNVIGRAETVAVEDPEEEAPFAGLEGLHVVQDGFVEDEEDNRVGVITEGDPAKLVGRAVDEDGDILDKKGNIVGHAERWEAPPEEEEEVDQLPPLSVLEGLPCNKAGKLVDGNGTVVGELIEGDAKKLAKSGITADAEGQFWDTKGHVIGRATTVAVEDPELESPFAGLEGLHVVDDGFVEDEEGNRVGVIVEGDASKLIGRSVDEDGDILDKKGSIVGHAERYEAPPEEEEAPPEEIDLSGLEGKEVNKAGMVIGEAGVPVARLVEGNPKECAGKRLDAEGQIWNDSGKVIGRVEMIPPEEREAKPEGPFAGLEGVRVIEDGKVADENGNVVGEVVEGNAKRLVGLAVDEDGDIVDKYGNVKGHADPLPEEEEAAPIDNSLLNGKQLNKQGFVVDENGNPLGRLVEGNAAELAGRFCDENGDIHSDTGKVVGHCEVIPDNERVHRSEGAFAGLEGVRVVKDGWVEDEEGNVVGQLTEGDPKKLVGMAVDEDGDIIDKYGNVKGHAERWEAEEETAVDMTALAGTEINKNGNAVDGNGRIIGRVVEGDVKSMIGKKVDGQGQIWDNAGNVVGRCELVFGEDTSPEGPFAGFEGLQINKDETVTTPAGDIVGRVVEGDIQKLLGHSPDEDGDIVDKNGNKIGRAERWSPEEKERRANPMSGRRVNSEGEVRDENGDLMGMLTEGDLRHCVGQEIDDAGNVVDIDGNKIGEVTLMENIDEETYVGPTEEEIAEAQKREEERVVAEKMGAICTQTLERMQPICKQIKEYMDKADRTPKDELDEEELVNNVKPLIEEAGRVLQECNGSLRGLDPDGKIAAQAKGRAGTGEATPEEHRLADTLKELTTTVVTTVDDAKKKLNDMPYAKKKLNPLWGLMTQPLFQILAAVGLLLAGVLGLVGQLLNGLGLGGLVNGLLGGLGIDKLMASFGIGGGAKKAKGKGASALSSIPLVGGMLGGGGK